MDGSADAPGDGEPNGVANGDGDSGKGDCDGDGDPGSGDGDGADGTGGGGGGGSDCAAVATGTLAEPSAIATAKSHPGWIVIARLVRRHAVMRLHRIGRNSDSGVIAFRTWSTRLVSRPCRLSCPRAFA